MKKRLFLMLAFAMLICYIPSVYAASVDVQGCSAALPNVAIDIRIVNTVHTVILVIQIAVPIVLVIFGMIDLFKSITAQKEEEIKKGRGIFVKRLISAVLVFFIIAIVKVIVSFAAGNEFNQNFMSCVDCFLNGANDDGTCK